MGSSQVLDADCPSGKNLIVGRAGGSTSLHGGPTYAVLTPKPCGRFGVVRRTPATRLLLTAAQSMLLFYVEINLLSRVILSMMTYQTRSVLGECYKGKSVSRRPLLPHLVHLDEHGSEVKTGCRQPVDNLADVFSDPEGNDKRPTCSTCARKWDKLQGQPK